MMKQNNHRAGFSLVEMLVSSAVSTVIGGVIFTLFFMYSNQANASISSLVMHQQYDNMARQIAMDIRRASFVLGPGETPQNFAAVTDTVEAITLCDRNGTILAQYALSGDVLTTGPQNVPLEAGGGAPKVVSGSSYFIIDSSRKSVKITLSLQKYNSQATTCTVPARKDVFQCRNW